MRRPISLALTVLTGFSGLVYEVAWQKYLATLLGSHSEATAAVLAIFLGGMAIGYEAFGRVARRLAERAGANVLLRRYGAVEASIGLWALAFPWLFSAAQRVSSLVPPGNEALSFAFDVALCALLIGPPAFLMGGTIPLLTQALSRTVAESTRVHAWIYAANTAGAVAGALAGGFVLVPWLGLDGVLRAMGWINGVAGAVFLLQGTLASESAAVAEPAPAGGDAPASMGALPWIAFLGGFATMALQTVANRVGALALGSSHFTFAMVAASFVLGIAVGSFAVAALRVIPRALIAASQWALVAVVGTLYLAVPLAPYGAHVLRTLFRDEPQAFLPYHTAVFEGLVAVLLVPLSLSGAQLPLLFHHLRDRYGDLGRIAGRLYGANTLGSLAGALLGGYVMLFWVDLADVYRVALAALVGSATLVTLRVYPHRRWLTAGACVAALACAALLPAWDPAHLASGAFRQRTPVEATYRGARAFFALVGAGPKVVFHRDDPVSTVTVIQLPRQGGNSRSIVNNGKSDGNTVADYPTMCLIALLPALYTDDVANAFVIGWGTGVTSGELTRLADTKRIRAAEISPGVIEAAPLFAPWNGGAAASPKVSIERRDAYRALLHARERYGVIASEPSNPWVAGVEMLFSREFLAAARSRLTPGGVYAQWIHSYESDPRTLALVLQTYATVFDHVAVWFTQSTDLVLLGFNGPIPTQAELERRFERPDLHAGLRRCGTPSWDELAAHELIPPGVLAPQPDLPVHTLRWPRLSDSAARAFFVGGDAPLPALAGATSAPDEPARGLLAERAVSLDENALASIARAVCEHGRPTECATWHAYWEFRFPHSERRLATLRGRASPAATATLDYLTALYRGEAPRIPGVDGVEAARLVTQLFARHFLRAIPFPHAGLRRVWSQCEQGPEALACFDARRAADRELVSLAGADAPD